MGPRGEFALICFPRGVLASVWFPRGVLWLTALSCTCAPDRPTMPSGRILTPEPSKQRSGPIAKSTRSSNRSRCVPSLVVETCVGRPHGTCETAQIFDALSGILKTSKKYKVLDFAGEQLCEPILLPSGTISQGCQAGCTAGVVHHHLTLGVTHAAFAVTVAGILASKSDVDGKLI
eukprot:m.142810 g.142810  ORF g.142810 m.142810 type:complete len:176 (+) comp17679_c0_seq29:291-818(+)